ncbi:MAG: c-type cytochrome [Candidatus Scalindua sp.]
MYILLTLVVFSGCVSNEKGLGLAQKSESIESQSDVGKRQTSEAQLLGTDTLIAAKILEPAPKLASQEALIGEQPHAKVEQMTLPPYERPQPEQTPPDKTFGDEPTKVVRLTKITFKPGRIQAKVGEAIKFINEDKFEHDVYIVRTANPNDILLEATTIPSGKSIAVTIDEDGLYTVYCTIHGGMSAKLTTTGSFVLTEAEKKRAAAKKVLPPIAKTGEGLFWGKGQCHQCHRVGDRTTQDIPRGPDLQDIGLRAGFRTKDLELDSGTDYLVQSVVDPSAYVVPGYKDDMPRVYLPPISLSSVELEAVIVYLQSLGGVPDPFVVSLPSEAESPVIQWEPYLKGDPAAGKVLFFDESSPVGCGKCHQVNGRGGKVGPDLTGIGGIRPLKFLVESILDPSARIAPAFDTVLVVTEDGQFITGIVSSETESYIEIQDPEGEAETIFNDEVKEKALQPLSLMPANYAKIMTVKQLHDILAYVATLK